MRRLSHDVESRQALDPAGPSQALVSSLGLVLNSVEIYGRVLTESNMLKFAFYLVLAVAITMAQQGTAA